MEVFYPVIILLLGFILDLIFGDPDYKYHPVRIIGNAIDFLQEKFKGVFACKKLEGIVLTFSIVIFAVSVYSALYILFNGNNSIAGFLVNVFFVYSMIALKDLFKHCGPVIDALIIKDMESARRATGMIVGRDINYLNEAGIIRAAIETLAENFVDGFLSPLFWYSTGCMIGFMTGINPVYSGIVFLLIFKVASTLDSMVGYKTEKYKDLGWAGARLDDIMNFIPARLSLIVLYFGAALTGLDPKGGMKVALRDRLKHDSPNSAHSESFVAGAINARLGGPTRYRDGIKKKPWLGEEYQEPSISDIKIVIKLLLFSAWIAVSVGLLILLCLI